MEQFHEKSFAARRARQKEDNLSITGLESDFLVAPIQTATQARVISGVRPSITYFNNLSHKRSSAAVSDDLTALSIRMSHHSNGSLDATPQIPRTPPLRPIRQSPNKEDNEARGRRDSTTSVTEATSTSLLVKSPSERSTKSVRSNYAVGTFQPGTLHVHPSSPIRQQTPETYECLNSGDVVIVRDIPVGTLFGYDTRSFEVREKGFFEGIKNLSPGAHLVWGGGKGSSLRQGFWLFSPIRKFGEFGEIIVKRWDQYHEVLEDEVSAAECRIQRSGLLEIEHRLLPYNNAPNTTQPDILRKRPHIWNDLTLSIQPALLTKVTGHGSQKWLVSTTHDVQPAENNVKEVGFRKDEVLKFMFPRSRQTFSSDSVGRERTDQAMDTTSHVRAIITGCCTHEEPDEIIGELQFCFLTGCTLSNIACMEQWAYIVKVLFKAFRLSVDFPIFFRKFIQAFHSQLIYDEDGFEGSILDHEAGFREDLKILLITFKSRLTELLLSKGPQITDEQNEVGKAFEELEAWLWKWNWDLRGNYVRSGRVQLEDGEFVEAELSEFEAEDERGYSGKGKDKERRFSSRKSTVGWKS